MDFLSAVNQVLLIVDAFFTPRLVCGSPQDDITPVSLLEKLADRIGCERKLDFEEWKCCCPGEIRYRICVEKKLLVWFDAHCFLSTG